MTLATYTINEPDVVPPVRLVRNSTITRTLKQNGPRSAPCPPRGGRPSSPSPSLSAWESSCAFRRRTSGPACRLRTVRRSIRQHARWGASSWSGAVLLGSLAVRTVTAEYPTGMIRSTFTAMPARRLVLAAEAAVAGGLRVPGGAARCHHQLRSRTARSSPASTSTYRLVIPVSFRPWSFAALGVSLVAIIGVGLGGLIRHTAAATTTLVLIIVGGAMFGQFLPAGLRQYLPGTALEAAVTVHRSAGLLGPGMAIIVLGVYAVVALTAALIRMGHGDA